MLFISSNNASDLLSLLLHSNSDESFNKVSSKARTTAGSVSKANLFLFNSVIDAFLAKETLTRLSSIRIF